MNQSPKMIKRHPLKTIALIFFVIFCGLSTLVYFTIGTGSIKSLIEQMLHREQVIARSGARSISSFIDLSSRLLLTLSNQENITNQELKKFIENFKDTPINGVIKTNRDGEIIAAYSNTENLSSGGSVANRDYFQIAKNSPNPKVIISKPIISQAVGASQNYKIPISVPIIRNNQFEGVISMSILISSLTNSYLEPLKISDKTTIVLIDQEGNLLNIMNSIAVGQNAFEYVKKYPFIGDKIIMPMIKEKLSEYKEQKYDIAIPDFSNGKITRTLIASSPIKVGENIWFLAITTPVEDALIFISPFILRNLLGIIVSFFISITISLFLFNRYIKN